MESSNAGEPALETVPSFDAMFVAEYPKMVALASAVCGSRAHGEDIAQEAMSRVNRNWAKVQGFDKPGAWVRRVTINLALSQKRKLMSEAKAVLRLGAVRPRPAVVSAVDDAVWVAVAELSKQQRAAVSLHFLEDRTIDEVADVLDIATSTARVHLHRARQALRDRFEQEDLS